MRLTVSKLVLALFGTATLFAAPLLRSEWNRVQVDPLKTSIYVGSVTLATTPFKRDSDTLTANYVAKVFPWFFWGETGQITIHFSAGDMGKLQRGERSEFTGEAINQKQKFRTVTGYADPTDNQSGKIKVRIAVDDLELIFNGPYTLSSFAMLAEGAHNE
jgi:hypothetical protein